MARTIGLLTSGGDCPGLNAAIRAVVRYGAECHGLQVMGFEGGWQGVLDNAPRRLVPWEMRGMLHTGGTVLGTSRVNPLASEDGVARIRQTMEIHELDGFVVIGGEGSLSGAAELHDAHDVPVVGIPKTIDNDVGGTDLSIGYPTALDIATEAVDRLHTTAESHNRVMLLEVMGRHAGWLAVDAGTAGGADAILAPEEPFDIDQVCRHLRRRHATGRAFSIVMVAEGAEPVPGSLDLPEQPLDELGRPALGGITHHLQPEFERRTGFPARVTILGHVQRGGAPSATDRVLATRLGAHATELAAGGSWGRMAGIRGEELVGPLLRDAVAELKRVPIERYRIAEVFFG